MGVQESVELCFERGELLSERLSGGARRPGYRLLPLLDAQPFLATLFHGLLFAIIAIWRLPGKEM